jgi:3-dehydroquinate dehydratase-2
MATRRRKRRTGDEIIEAADILDGEDGEPASVPAHRTRRVAVIHGPNLNLLGTREPHIYGTTTLDQINDRLRDLARDLGAEISFFQSAREGALIEHVHTLRGRCDGIVINAAGYSHTSIALRDALAAVSIPFVEVHLTNVYARESYRHHSALADAARGVIVGFGALSYELALGALLHDD